MYKSGRNESTNVVSFANVRWALVLPLVFGFLLGSEVQAQFTNCAIRYTYNSAGDRTQRDWFCWGGDTASLHRFSVLDPLEMGQLADNALRLAPNPAGGSVVIQLDHPVVGANLEVVDLSGRVLRSHEMNGSAQREDLEGLAPATYYIRITWQNMQLVAQFIKLP